jgi:DNA-binding winged helix-turn-helix (wHTH) protein/TolB-like protein/cytochrome c-type biogenesis protein CcmH/NrfG
MADSPQVSYEFGSFHLNPRERWLLLNGRHVSLTPKAFVTLVALVERTGQLIDKQELMDRLWPDTVVEEGTLARNISDLRKVLGEDPGERKYIETVPKRGYRFVAPVRVVTIQPATPTGLASKVALTQSAVREAHQFLAVRYGILCLSVLVAALIGLRTCKSATPASAAQPVRSIAVFPFRLLESEPSDHFLGVGLADALIARLNRLHDLVVRPASAIVHFDPPNKDAVEYGYALGVQAVLDGSIQRSGEHLRVTADLVRVADRTSIWSEQFDETSSDLLTIEDSISAKVVDALVLALNHTDRQQLAQRETIVADAHLAYLRGRYYWNRRTPDDLEKAVASLEDAVRKDPSYALAYAGLADAYVISSGYSLIPPRQIMPKARAAARRALDLNPSIAEPHTTLALIAMNYDWDWAEAERQYLIAIDLNPNYAVAHAWYGEYLAFMGRFDEGIRENARAQELDPLSIIISTDGGKILGLAGEYDRAIVQLRKTLEMDPSYLMARVFLARVYSEKGLHEQAFATLDDLDPWILPVVLERGMDYARAGRKRDAQAMLDRLTLIARHTYVSPQYFAYLETMLGMTDRAFTSLDRMCAERAVGPIGLKIERMWDPIRHDRRFEALLRRVKLPLNN